MNFFRSFWWRCSEVAKRYFQNILSLLIELHPWCVCIFIFFFCGGGGGAHVGLHPLTYFLDSSMKMFCDIIDNLVCL